MEEKRVKHPKNERRGKTKEEIKEKREKSKGKKTDKKVTVTFKRRMKREKGRKQETESLSIFLFSFFPLLSSFVFPSSFITPPILTLTK